MSDSNTVVEVATTISSTASKTTYAAAASSFLGWLISIDFIAFTGLFIAVAGFFVNIYYKRLEDRRAQEIHELTKQKMQDEHNELQK